MKEKGLQTQEPADYAALSLNLSFVLNIPNEFIHGVQLDEQEAGDASPVPISGEKEGGHPFIRAENLLPFNRQIRCRSVPFHFCGFPKQPVPLRQVVGSLQPVLSNLLPL